MTPEREREIREEIAEAASSRFYADDDEQPVLDGDGEPMLLDGNDAWEWYANQGADLLAAARDLLAEIDRLRGAAQILRARVETMDPGDLRTGVDMAADMLDAYVVGREDDEDDEE